MATNPYISKKVRSEQHLYEDLVIESLKFYGEDVYYIPREIVNKDKIFGDDVPSRFSDAYKIETYIENTEGFDGEGDLFTKFGIELRDQATFVFARRRWKKLIGDNLAEVGFRPREGDIIYLPMSNSMFEVLKVETETPFYQLSQLPTFRLQCELFEYSDEDFDTNIASIDAVEYEGAFQYKVTMEPSSENNAELSIANDAFHISTITGGIKGVDIVKGGVGYVTPPIVTASAPQTTAKFGQNSLSSNRSRGYSNNFLFTSDNGTVELFLYQNTVPSPTEYQSFLTVAGNDTIDPNIMTWGIDGQSRISYSFREPLNGEPDVNTLTTNSQIVPGNWHHLVIGIDSNGSGKNSRLYAYLDGTQILDSDTNRDLSLISDNGLSLGQESLRTIGGISYSEFGGKIDELRALVGSKSDIFDGRISTTTTHTTQSYTLTIASGDGNDYTFDGGQSDRNGEITDTTDPDINIIVGDTLVLQNNSGGHPAEIKDDGSNVQATETGGATTFTPGFEGTYTYQCTVGGHENMVGNIIVSAQPAPVTSFTEVVSAFDSNSNTALLEHFEGSTTILTTDITDGVITSVNIVDSGSLYDLPPTLTIDQHLDSSNFLIGETVTQTNASYTIKGEVTRWSDEDRILQLAHVGSTDGTFKTFSTSRSVVGASSNAQWVPKLVEDLQEIQPTAQNKVFDDFEADFLDFSESNPFGDMN